MTFDESMVRRQITPWGLEVKKRLLDNNMKQDDLVDKLTNMGFEIEKAHLSNLLYGIGITNRKDEIQAISKILNIAMN